MGYPWTYQGEIGVVGPAMWLKWSTTGGAFWESAIIIRLRSSAVQLLTRERIKRALDDRKRVKPVATSCRLIDGEGDLLLGLVVDRFEDYLVV